MKISMKSFLLLTLTAILGIIIQTCKEDKIGCQECNGNDEVDICDSFPTPTGGIGTIKQKPNQRHFPCFNPNNSSEFIYIKEVSGKYSLIVHNLDTKLETVLPKSRSLNKKTPSRCWYNRAWGYFFNHLLGVSCASQHARWTKLYFLIKTSHLLAD